MDGGPGDAREQPNVEPPCGEAQAKLAGEVVRASPGAEEPCETGGHELAVGRAGFPAHPQTPQHPLGEKPTAGQCSKSWGGGRGSLGPAEHAGGDERGAGGLQSGAGGQVAPRAERGVQSCGQ